MYYKYDNNSLNRRFEYDLKIMALSVAIESINTTEALQQELDSLRKCYDVTNESWKQQQQEIEQLKAFTPKHGECIYDAEQIRLIMAQNKRLQAQAGKAIEVLTEWETLIVSGQFKHDRCTNNLIHEALSFLKAGDI